MAEKKHGPMFPREVLYPVRRPAAAKRIDRAVAKVVSKMRPISLCWCGKFCATHRKLAALQRQSN